MARIAPAAVPAAAAVPAIGGRPGRRVVIVAAVVACSCRGLGAGAAARAIAGAVAIAAAAAAAAAAVAADCERVATVGAATLEAVTAFAVAVLALPPIFPLPATWVASPPAPLPPCPPDPPPASAVLVASDCVAVFSASAFCVPLPPAVPPWPTSDPFAPFAPLYAPEL
jgi:hypothetical protein